MAVHYTPIASSTGVANTAALFNSRLQELDNAIVANDTSIANIISGAQAIDVGRFSASTILTLSSNVSGAVPIAKTRHQVDTFGAAAAGELVTLNGGLTGQILFLTSVNAARVVTVKQSGNIKLASGGDHVLDVDKALMLSYNGSNWSDVNSYSTQKILSRRVELTGTVGTITISSLPQNFSFLQLVIEARTNVAATSDSLLLRANADATAANYQSQYIIGVGATAAAAEQIGTQAGWFLPISAIGSTGTAGNGCCIVEIVNYAATTRRRCIVGRSFTSALATTGNQYMLSFGGTWTNAAAGITSLTLLPSGGTLFAVGTAVTLYAYLG